MTIEGHGDIASVLKDREGFCFLASGVSNSKEDREFEYQREKDLLLSQPRDLRLVYFSSIRVFYPLNDRYTQHKREMEQLVKDNFPKYCIIRMQNIDWGTNPHTLINFLRNQKKKGEPLDIQNTYRYVVDKEEFLRWIDLIPDFNCEMSVLGQRLSIKQIVKKYV